MAKRGYGRTARLCGAACCAAAAVMVGGGAWVDPAPSPPAAAIAGSSAPPDAAAQQSPLVVAGWTLTDGNRRLTLTLHGNEAAVARLRTGQRLSIKVQWISDAATTGAPALITELPIGQPGLVSAFESQIRRQGYFVWHSWSEKRALSPGQWNVELSEPDGRPVPCPPQQGPCRLSFTIG